MWLLYLALSTAKQINNEKTKCRIFLATSNKTVDLNRLQLNKIKMNNSTLFVVEFFFE